MLEITQNTPQQANTNVQPQKSKKVFKMVEHDRMGGSVPVWESPSTQKDKVLQKLSHAQDPIHARTNNFENALAIQADRAHVDYGQPNEEFGFGDLVDMVNPLQHIPLVGSAYREITGDEIKPISRIIGGAVFGGPAGAASGIVNTVVEHETGKDITENAMSFIRNDEEESWGNDPQERIERALDNADKDSENRIPGNALSFVDLGGQRQSQDTQTQSYARTAGTIPRGDARPPEDDMLSNLPAREGITIINLSRMPYDN